MSDPQPYVAPRPPRSAMEIKASIEANRQELAGSIASLKGEVTELTNWRKQIVRHQPQVLAGAAVAGFVLAGGLAAIGGVLSRRRRKRALGL
jgi:hypothetical protein